jgi:FdhD protein
MPPHASFPIRKYADGAFVESADELAVEEPLEIRVRGRAISVTMRTPGHDAELAAGFLFTEGVIRNRADILNIVPCDADRPEAANRIDVLLAPLVHVDFARLTRHVFTTSSCGLCGKATIESIRQNCPPLPPGPTVDAATLLSLPAAMRSAQPAFDRTGGLHAAALFDTTGRLLILREDVGRHNALDKVIGHALLTAQPMDQTILLVSGRASFEIMQKALSARIPLIAAVSAPSSLAVQIARESGQTLAGFLREGRMNVYAHPDRIGKMQP